MLREYRLIVEGNGPSRLDLCHSGWDLVSSIMTHGSRCIGEADIRLYVYNLGIQCIIYDAITCFGLRFSDYD
jgi:hypothetical protein